MSLSKKEIFILQTMTDMDKDYLTIEDICLATKLDRRNVDYYIRKFDKLGFITIEMVKRSHGKFRLIRLVEAKEQS